MTTTQRIIKNSLFLSGGHIVAKVINLALLLILTRMLGSDGFGLYSFALAFVMIFMVFAQMGISTFLVKSIAADKTKAEAFIGTAAPMVLVFSVLTVILINGAAWAVQWSVDERLIIFLFSIYLFFDSWGRFFFSIFRAYERMEFEAAIHISERIALLFSALLTWAMNASLPILIGLFAAAQILKAALAFLMVHRYFVKVKLKWNLSLAVSMLRQAYPFALMVIFGTISTRIDIIMLKLFHSPEAAGIYNAARKLTESLAFIPENIAFALFPAISILYVSKRNEFNITFENTLKYMIIIALPLTAGIFILAPRIIDLLFEAEFAKAYIALRWLGIWLGLLFLKFTFATTLNAIGRQHLFSLYAGIAMIINVALNYILIPHYDILGASLATVISETVGVLLVFAAVRSFIQRPNFSVMYFKIAMAGIAVSATIYLIRDWNILLVIAVPAFVYSSFLMVFKVISKSDYQYFAGLFQNKNLEK